jgi:hypothetical protein
VVWINDPEGMLNGGKKKVDDEGERQWSTT